MNIDNRIRAAFHELTISLLCLFELHQVPGVLINTTAEELERILHHHLTANEEGLTVDEEGLATKGKLALERFLDELEAQDPALIGLNPQP